MNEKAQDKDLYSTQKYMNLNFHVVKQEAPSDFMVKKYSQRKIFFLKTSIIL